MHRSSKLLVLVAAIGGVLSKGCGSLESEPHGTGGAQGAGGTSASSGGVVHSGGAAATGGAPGTGGVTSSGGAPGTGGAFETGGSGVGGASAGTGGSASGGASAGRGGVSTETGGRDAGGGASAGTGGPGSGGASAGRGGASNGTGGSGTGGAATGGGGALGKFSFFVTSLEAMRRLSGSSDGFGGDLRFGEANGLAGADKICATIADASMPGASAKGWRAFLSALNAPDESVNAIDRVGEGPWYDRRGRLLAAKKADLLEVRPRGADPTIINDLPNEYGIPNHNPDGLGEVDNHDVMTGTGTDGKLTDAVFGKPTQTCYDWTSSAKEVAPGDTSQTASGPLCGHSWSGNWMAILTEGGCAAGVNLEETGPPRSGVLTVGTGGGYGAIYCFALKP